MFLQLLYDKYQLSLMNPRDALHHRKRAANKGGRSSYTELFVESSQF